MACDKEERPERLQLWIKLGALALLAGCGAFCYSQAAFICTPRCPWHSKTTVIERPARKCDLPIPDHPTVDFRVRWFSERYKSSFQTQLDRSRFYSSTAQEIFTRKGLPKDLIYVALIESGFSSAARSRADAAGIWQFIPQTGSRFGLEQNKWVDERHNPVKAARAAADYLSLLYDHFGSWSLALAAYNAGENAVQEALDQSGLNTFWDLLKTGYLPSETMDYVPKVFAAVKIVRNPDLYGFRVATEHFIALRETVSVPGGLKLSWAGKQIGVSEEVLQNSNPELCQSITPPGRSKYELSLPLGTGDDLISAIAKRPQYEEKQAGKATGAKRPGSLISYRVKSGDTLSSIAGKHKCSVIFLAALNGMKPSQTLRTDRALKLPAGAPPSSPKARIKRAKEDISASNS
jgi:membrane-bound lytic murein transglycosylase D